MDSKSFGDFNANQLASERKEDDYSCEPADWDYEVDGFWQPKGAKKVKPLMTIDEFFKKYELELLLIMAQPASEFKGSKFKLRRKYKKVYTKQSYK